MPLEKSVNISIERRKFGGKWSWKAIVQVGMETFSFKNDNLEALILDIEAECGFE